MVEHDRAEDVRQARTTPADRPSTRATGPAHAPAAAQLLRLQRAAGNRAVARELQRWAAHPDKDKKGQFMTDQMAADWDRFNPPLSK